MLSIMQTITGLSVSVNTPPDPVQYPRGTEEDAGDDDDHCEIGIEGTARAGAVELGAGQAVFIKNKLRGIKKAMTLNLEFEYYGNIIINLYPKRFN